MTSLVTNPLISPCNSLPQLLYFHSCHCVRNQAESLCFALNNINTLSFVFIGFKDHRE